MSPINLTARPASTFKNLLWIDCTGAMVVGVMVVTLSGWLSRLEGLPQELLVVTGAVNLLYGSYSLSLAVRAERPMRLIKLLIVANLAWAPVCLMLLAVYAATATPFAYLHLGGEAIYVGTLAVFEWRYRELLRTA